MSASPLLDVSSLSVTYKVPRGTVWPGPPQILRAVEDVSFSMEAGETLGVVGESGCGKSTLGRAILRLLDPAAGAIRWKGRDITEASQEAMKPLRKALQIVFQDPLASLDPRMTAGEIVAEPLRVFEPHLDAAARSRRVAAALDEVGLGGHLAGRYPHAFSGGQCQRIGIARAMILKPELIVCDEPVSALDVSIQAQIVTLLKSLQAEYGLALLFISHDLAVVRHVADRVLVLYLGRAMEIAPTDRIVSAPRHPYTKALLSSVPIPDPVAERARTAPRLEGEVPSPLDPPSGCVFRTRCPKAQERCARETPRLTAHGEGEGLVACHFPEEA
jgi:oligopeptide transport system ATP-binding protein